MKILVTGGCGFIGSAFVRYWLKNHPDDQVVNLDVLTYAGHPQNLQEVQDNPNYTFIHGDITNPQDVEKAMEGVDTVVHFAAESHVDRSIVDPLAFVKTNVLGTGIVLQSALNKEIKKFHHISCYDEETMAFTRNGLKRYDQLKRGNEVLSLNPETNILEWKLVEKVIIQDYTGKMVKARAKSVDLMVTPNHRMLFQAKRTKKLSFKEASRMTEDAINKLPKYYQWEGRIPSAFRSFPNLEDFGYILGIFIGDGIVAYQEKKVLSKSGLSKSNYIQYARSSSSGQFISMGKVGDAEYVISKSWRIFLDIPLKDECRIECEDALTNLGIRWHAQKGKSGEHIYFTSEIFAQMFLSCGKGAKNKHIPSWALNMPVPFLQKLFKGLVDSDGSANRVFFTSSPKLAQQFMELCVKLNLSPTISTRYTDTTYQGRRIHGLSYVISWGKEWRSVRREIVKEVDYTGKIWCLKVQDNKNFLVYRKGRTMFSGNTDEVFGHLGPDDPPFSEKTPYAPRTPYAASKAGSDHLVRAFSETYHLPVTITNCANNFGPFHDPEKLIPRFITNLLEDKKVPLMGKGENIRSWLYVDDHCRAIELVLEKGEVGETYVVDGEEKTNMEVTEKLLQILGKDESMIEFVEHRLGHDFRYAIDASKLKSLGWKPEHTFDEWLEKTVQWFQDNEWWWKPLKEGRPIVDRVAQKGYS